MSDDLRDVLKLRVVKHTDTERLDFLLKFISIDDVGDEHCVPGVVVRSEDLEEKLSVREYQEVKPGVMGNPIMCHFGENLRVTIDRAIDEYGQ